MNNRMNRCTDNVNCHVGASGVFPYSAYITRWTTSNTSDRTVRTVHFTHVFPKKEMTGIKKRKTIFLTLIQFITIIAHFSPFITDLDIGVIPADDLNLEEAFSVSSPNNIGMKGW